MDEPLQVPTPEYMTEELQIFQDAVDRFLIRECVPHIEKWHEERGVSREIWRKAGETGLLMASAPVEYGGGGGTMAHEAVIIDRLGRHDCEGFMLPVQNLGFGPYITNFASEEQKHRWIPKLASGELIGAMGMSEPNAGSDLAAIRTTAVRDGNEWVINGGKIFTTLGWVADIVMIAAKTDPSAGSRGISLFIVETNGLPGFARGKLLDTIGSRSHGVCELFFDNMRVPADALLGGVEGQGFTQMMANLVPERLISVYEATAMIERTLEETLRYVKDRRAFGKAIIDFQNSQFVLADCKTEATIAKTFAQHCTQRYLEGTLDVVTAAMAKLWICETLGKIADRCLQLFGGYGYINEYPIAHIYKDARLFRIGGGTSEIMRLIISRSL